ncbi:flagellar motor switch protein FliN [Pararhizobium gei]|uniref:flagellar motor switch protein FliN n=1 Tax=Pararhizobium gei TaxID=1395951 RepID=UPI0023DA8984|nr:flagellar motor switch protein FliN [Rhizobium gei]
MAPKKALLDDKTILNAGDAELDQAIDDLRGVLQSDATGSVPDAGFGMDFAATSPMSDLSDFGSISDTGAADLDGFGGDFGGTSFGDADLSASPAGSGHDSFGGGSSFDEAASSEPGSSMTSNLDLIMDIPIDVQIVLGSSRMQVSGLMNLTEGATIALDRRIGEPVEIVVNGRVIGRGEITVLEGDETRFGVKLIEIKGSGKS